VTKIYAAIWVAIITALALLYSIMPLPAGFD